MSTGSNGQQVIVVGGGLGGLLIGAELKRRGIEPLVLEAGGHPGGVARTIREDGYLLEPAAGSLLLPSPDLSPIFQAAGVPLVTANPEARTRFVYERGTLHEVPESPKFLLTGLVSLRAKLRAAREPWITTPPPDAEESILDFHTRRFGRDVGQLGAELMAHGVFAGDPAALSIQAAFPKLTALEQETGSIVRTIIQRRKTRPKGTPRASVHVAPNGMADIAARLADYLGDGFETNSPVHSVAPDGDRWRVESARGVDSASLVILALAPAQASKLLTGPLASLLSDRPAAPVAVVGLGGPEQSLHLPRGFGALAGPHSGIRALGILFESEYAPGRAPEGHQLAKGIYGGSADPGIMDKSDDEIAALMCGELGRIVGQTADPSWIRIVRSSIPQYPIGHAAWLRQVDEQLTLLPGIHLAGWGYRGIGVSSLGADAARIVTSVVAGED